jgi:uncharacterized protein with HEPN domain
MSKRDTGLLIADMLESIARIRRYVAGMDYDAFLADERTCDAVVRNVEIIGEASKQVPEDFKQAHTALPWQQMAGMRNRIVHDYTGVDLAIVWDVAQNALPKLQTQLEALVEPGVA